MEDSQVSSGIVGLQGMVLFQEVSASLENTYLSVLGASLEYACMCTRIPFGVCTYVYWSPFGVSTEVYWSPFGVCTYLYVLVSSSFEVCNYLLEVSYSIDQIIRLMFRFFF